MANIITHEMVWAALDNLAHENHITCSRMAVVSGLDMTALNKSKRIGACGKAHWPSVETVVKIMAAMDISWIEFAKYFPDEFVPQQ